MDTETETTNGHTLTPTLMLQASCTTCGERFEGERVKAGSLPHCRGRMARGGFHGHWFDYGPDPTEDAGHVAHCRLCGQSFAGFYPYTGGTDQLTYQRRMLHAPLGVEKAKLPPCRECDHAGSLVERATSPEGHRMRSCTACEGTLRTSKNPAYANR